MTHTLNRRDFLKGFAAGGFMLALSALGCKAEPTTTAPELKGADSKDPHTQLAISL
jgi:TAT (twin-arginine translocation) pathway signal sequence